MMSSVRDVAVLRDRDALTVVHRDDVLRDRDVLTVVHRDDVLGSRSRRITRPRCAHRRLHRDDVLGSRYYATYARPPTAM